MSQFLIGMVLRDWSQSNSKRKIVSIPYRYGTPTVKSSLSQPLFLFHCRISIKSRSTFKFAFFENLDIMHFSKLHLFRHRSTDFSSSINITHSYNIS